MWVEKFESLQNVFLLTDYVCGTDYPSLARRLCSPRLGLGADGLIAVQNAGNLPEMFFFNADGSRAFMCGNGLRCVACLSVYRGQKNRRFFIQTEDGAKQVSVKSKKPFVAKVLLGKPEFFAGQVKTDLPVLSTIRLEGKTVFLFKTVLGVPHAVLIDQNELSDLAPKISAHKIFAEGANVDFVTVKSPDEIYVKTFERGVGWTLSCGTGGGASAAVCFATKRCLRRVKAEYDGGAAIVSVEEEGVFATAQANRVFCGEFDFVGG